MICIHRPVSETLSVDRLCKNRVKTLPLPRTVISTWAKRHHQGPSPGSGTSYGGVRKGSSSGIKSGSSSGIKGSSGSKTGSTSGKETGFISGGETGLILGGKPGFFCWMVFLVTTIWLMYVSAPKKNSAPCDKNEVDQFGLWHKIIYITRQIIFTGLEHA